MSGSRILRDLLLAWLGSALVWGVVGFGFAAQLVLAAEVDWVPALRSSLREWAPWAVLSPLVVALAVRFPFERGRWPLSLVVHLATCAAVVIACGWLSHSLGVREPVPSDPRGRRFAEGSPRGPADRPPPDAPRIPFREGPPLRMRGGPGEDGRRPGPPRAPLLMRARLNIPVYWILVTVTGAVLQSRRARERERRSLELAAKLAEARLTSLRAQLQPHFLFNALNAISTLVHRDPHAADEMIANLSDFLRLTLEHAGTQELPLARELEFVRRYLAIEQVRFGDRLRITEDFPEATLAARVPVLLLQPLVENALKHGLQPRVGPGHLALSARVEGSQLVLQIEDDGIGIRSDPDAAPGASTGIGIANTRSRLEQLHGGMATLTLSPRPGGGTRVEVRLPFLIRPHPTP